MPPSVIAFAGFWLLAVSAVAQEVFAPAPMAVASALKGWVDEDRIGGAVLVAARKGEPAYAATAGSLDGERPMRADAVFRIYSMTKPVVCAAALTLVEEGRIELAAPVSRYLPEFADLEALREPGAALTDTVALRRAPTIRDLMTHTSGLTSASAGSEPLRLAYAAHRVYGRRSPGGLAAMVRRLAKLPLLHQPGHEWSYGASTGVLGRVLEVVSGETLDTLLRKRIFDPLGMRDTGFHVTPEQRDRFAAMYFADAAGKLQAVTGEPPLGQPPFVEPAFTEPPPTLSGGGGLVSTARDYLRFAQALLPPVEGTRVLAANSIATMTRPHLTEQEQSAPFLQEFFPGSNFGLCVAVATDPAARNRPGGVGSFGWSGFGSTHFWVDPEEKLIGVFMTQVRPAFARLNPAEIEAIVYADSAGR